jgi:hypothetical protein
VTEAERIDRQTLLRRAAAVAGGAYVAPMLTSAAGAAAAACSGKCRVGAKGDRRCSARGGSDCACVRSGPDPKRGVCKPRSSLCPKCHPDTCCGSLESCGACGNGMCFVFFGPNSRPNDCGDVPGVCVDLRDGFCSSFQPCNNGRCPPGQCCFSSCCGEPLCGDPCTGASSGAALSVRKGGPGMLFR